MIIHAIFLWGWGEWLYLCFKMTILKIDNMQKVFKYDCKFYLMDFAYMPCIYIGLRSFLVVIFPFHSLPELVVILQSTYCR